MLNIKKTIWIYWRKLDSSYAHANKKVLVEAPRVIGSSLSGVNRMIANHEEQKEMMKSIVGVSPTSTTWDTVIKHYWDSLREEIPNSGKKLDLSFTYDITDPNKADYISAINKNIESEKAKLRSHKDLKDYIDNRLKNVDIEFKRKMDSLDSIESEKQRDTVQNDAYKIKYDSIFMIEADRFKVGTATNPFHYMLYKYCLVYSQVANSYELANKSKNIRFYLHSEEDVKKFKAAQSETNRNRMSIYRKVISDIATVENVLYAMGKGNIIPDDDNDKLIMLEEESKDNTNRFISIADNPSLKTMAIIKKYITLGVLKEIEGTSIIVDGNDSSVTIGNDIDEAIVYFNNKNNTNIITKYSDRYKGVPKND